MLAAEFIGDMESTEKCDGSVTKEDGVLIKENAEHTHPSSKVQALVDKVVSTREHEKRLFPSQRYTG